MKKQKKIAIIYDFDSTLLKGYMQNEMLIPYFGMECGEFWEKANKLMRERDMDEILAFMYTCIKVAKEKNKKLTKDLFVECGKNLNQFFDGVVDWFDRINAYGKSCGVVIEHYVISCGFQEMIENCKIAPFLKKIFASRYLYNENGEAEWPAYAVNYTQKMQYLARIEKNLTDELYDSGPINSRIKDKHRYIPYSRMIYLGDGGTDVPSMKMVRSQGGHSLCVYDAGSKTAVDIAKKLVKDNRVDVAVPADYTEGSKLDIMVKRIINDIE